MYGSKSITGINEYQWELFKKIHLEFFYPILQNTEIQKLINDWMNKNEYISKWDTYPLKIVDNLVIGVSVIFVK